MKLQNNIDDKSPRLINLDFLRGLFIILALDQHFTYYINMWYVDYFRDAIALTTTYKIHFPLIGQQISTDTFNHWLAVTFTPWVSQIYLTMAAFNLAKRDQHEFAKTLPLKLKTMGLIFIFFVMENMIVAPNFGQAISFYPIMLWMVILGLIALIYRYLGISGVVGLTIFSLLRFIIPFEMLSSSFEDIIRSHFHPGFEYDARPEYFILSGCLGFLMGYVHFHKQSIAHKKDLLFGFIGTLLAVIYLLFGDKFTVDSADIFRTEHDLARSFSGTCYILGIQAIVISAFLWLERKHIRLKVPLITWVGQHSLLIFGLHRIFFVRMIAPVAVFLGSLFGFTLGASTLEIYLYISITLALCAFVKYSRITDLILLQKG